MAYRTLLAYDHHFVQVFHDLSSAWMWLNFIEILFQVTSEYALFNIQLWLPITTPIIMWGYVLGGQFWFPKLDDTWPENIMSYSNWIVSIGPYDRWLHLVETTFWRHQHEGNYINFWPSILPDAIWHFHWKVWHF